MKKLSLILMILVLTISFVACAPDNGTQLYYDYDLSEYITVGDFSKTVSRESDDYKKIYRQYYHDIFGEELAYPVKEGVVQEGDYVNINFYGSYNGEEFDGGTQLGYALRVGDGQFTVAGFEKGIVGTAVGEECELELTLPDDYHNKDLAGEKVKYSVLINTITRYAQPTEDQVKSYGFKSVADYEKQADDFAIGVCVFNSASKESEILKYPEKETELLVEDQYKNYKKTYEGYGMTVEQYVASVGWDMNRFDQHLLDSVQKDFKVMPRDLLSYYILDKYNSKLTLSEIEEFTIELKEKHGDEFDDISDIALERYGVYSKALKVCRDMAEVIG